MAPSTKPASERQPPTDDAPEPLDPAHCEAVDEGLADMRAGRFATDEEIEAAFDRFGRPPR